MNCSICNKTQLIIKNNLYFCPGCQLYLGKVKPNTLDPVTPIIGNRYKTILQSSEYSTKVIEDKPTIDKASTIKKYLAYPLFTLVIGLLYIIFSSWGNYIDPYNFCRIGVTGKKDSSYIFKAIESIKNTDPSSYQTLCKYINQIEESNCLTADPHINSGEAWKALNAGGCYIKGTKTIYLTPENQNRKFDQKDVIQNIKNNAKNSQSFWEGT